MKSKFSLILAVLSAITFVSCSKGNNDEKKDVSLIYAGNVQELYGDENGYPQAVIMAKTAIISENAEWFSNFTYELAKTPEWLKTASSQTVYDAVVNHIKGDMKPSFSKDALTQTTIDNCGIYFKSATESKTEINTFLAEINAVSDTACNPSVADDYFSSVLPTETVATLETDISVYMPDGAPALALSKLMSEDSTDDKVEYNVVDATTIASFLGVADVLVLPVTAMSKLIVKSGAYSLLGTVTHGNLFLLTKNGNTVLTKDNLSVLKGKTVGCIQVANVPGLTLKVLLSRYDLEWNTLDGTSEPDKNKVNIRGINPTDVSPALNVDYILTAEPSASKVVKK